MAPAPYTDQQIANQITREGWHWHGNNGDAVIYYSFSSDLGVFGTDTEYGLNNTQQVWVETALAELAEIFDLTFVETSEPANTSSNYPIDIIQFVNDTGNGTYAQWWSYGNGDSAFANVYFDQSWSSNQSQNLEYGSYGYMTMLHEILHTLGLEHPGEYNAGSGQSITYQNNAEFEQDTHRYSVMSYFNSYEDGSGAVFYDTEDNEWVYPRTPMVYDILAMTSGSFDGLFGGYGFNTTTRDGDTVYGHNANSGINAAYDFDQYDAPVLTIYDAGGTDTLDLSSDTVSSESYINYNPDDTIDSYGTRARSETLIDLREGQYSSTHGMTYNIGIAFGTVVENAVGTQFNDTIHGNAADNKLYGGSDGADILYGYDGADFLDGGLGTDQIFGGLGDDTIRYDALDDWAGGNINGGGGFDTLLFDMVLVAVDLLAYGFEQSALYLVDVATELWSEIYEYYNPSDNLTEREVFFDDGTLQIVMYDFDSTETWSEWVRTYDADGNLTNEVYVSDTVPPLASADTNSVTEDNVLEPSGNLLTNDDPGIGDLLTLSTVSLISVNPTGETEITGAYGALFVQADGSYRYVLDNTNAAVDALNDSDTLIETFNYTANNSAGASSADLVVTIYGSTDLVADFSLVPDVLETGKYGNKFDGVMDEDGLVTAIFDSTGSDLLLSFKGYDIEDNEVEVLLNGASLGLLSAGPDNDLGDYEFLIAADQQSITGDNTIEFVMNFNPARIWGVTDIVLKTDTTQSQEPDPSADFSLVPDVLETGKYGNKFDGVMDEDGLVTAIFDSTGSDLLLSFKGYDIEDNEVEVLLNGASLGLLSAGPDNDLGDYEFLIAADQQSITGDNTIEFVMNFNPARIWGVTDIVLKTDTTQSQEPDPSADFSLVPDVLETGKYGNKFDGVMDEDGLVTAIFDSTGSDLLLSFKGYDIEDNEVEVLLNGASLGLLSAGPDNDLGDYEFLIAADQQSITGDNTIEFVMNFNPARIWGVTDVLLDDIA